MPVYGGVEKSVFPLTELQTGMNVDVHCSDPKTFYTGEVEAQWERQLDRTGTGCKKCGFNSHAGCKLSVGLETSHSPSSGLCL